MTANNPTRAAVQLTIVCAVIVALAYLTYRQVTDRPSRKVQIGAEP